MRLELTGQFHALGDQRVNVALTVFAAFGVVAENLFQLHPLPEIVLRKAQDGVHLLIEENQLQSGIENGERLTEMIHAFDDGLPIGGLSFVRHRVHSL